MNPFEDPGLPSYELVAEYVAGAYRVDVKRLLDILEGRATLSLRIAGSPGTEERIADFERGHFAALQELYKALKSNV